MTSKNKAEKIKKGDPRACRTCIHQEEAEGKKKRRASKNRNPVDRTLVTARDGKSEELIVSL